MIEPLLHWSDPAAARRFRTGVSLHSHTSFSRETMSFVPRHTQDVPYLSSGIRRLEAQFRERHGYDLDYAGIWWTPPLSPREALALERGQIENTLGIPGLVSLTDHDDVRAGLAVRPLGSPVSVEWTVPMGPVFFHLGLHNIAADLMPALRNVTTNPQPARICEVLAIVHANPESLIILNHLLWDEVRAGRDVHRDRLTMLLDLCRPFLHALELNGLRPWNENREVCRLAESLHLPVISGGDRHGLEPNANINLTDAETFEEFAAEVRAGTSTVLFLSQYRRNIRTRMLRVMCDVLRDTPDSRWNDRVFYHGRRLSELLGHRAPGVIGQFLTFIRVAEVFL